MIAGGGRAIDHSRSRKAREGECDRDRDDERMYREVTRAAWEAAVKPDPESPFCCREAAGGESWSTPVGEEVVVFLPGYDEQSKSLQGSEPASALRWTSFRSRRFRECGVPSTSGRRVESTANCVVTGARYFFAEEVLAGDVSGEGVAPAPASAPEPARNVGSPARDEEREGTDADADADAAVDLPDILQLAANAQEGEAGGPAEPAGPSSPEAEPAEGDAPSQDPTPRSELPYIRLTLRSADGGGEEFHADYHVNRLDCGEYVVKRERYQRALRRRFKIGDRVKMFFRDPTQTDLGQWFKGTVRGTHRRSGTYEEHLLRESKWECVEVLWELSSDSREISRVNMWELEALPRYDNNGKVVNGRDEVPFDPRDFVDEDWMPRTRGRPKRQREEGPQVPQTIKFGEGSSKHKTMNWSATLCHVCKQPDGLVRCMGQCLRSFHPGCVPGGMGEASSSGSKWYCADCKEGSAVCAICQKSGKAGVDVHKCKMGSCGSFYHIDCLKNLPVWSVGWGQKNIRSAEAAEEHLSLYESGQTRPVFVCPGHFCHECHLSGDALRMLRCSNCGMHAYHASHVRWDHCLKVASDKNLICPYCTYKAFHPEGAAAMPDLLTYTPTLDAPTVGRVRKLSPGGASASQLFLVGKKRFLFGSHTKGGGCDFMLNLKGIKFHSEIVAEAPGRYRIRCNAAGPQARCKVPLVVNRKIVNGPKGAWLKDGDRFEIGTHKFAFDVLDINHESVPTDLGNLKFPDELSLERPDAAPSHAEAETQMNGFLQGFDIAGYNFSFSRLKKSQQKRDLVKKDVNMHPESSKSAANRSRRERKVKKYTDMYYSDEEDADAEGEDTKLDERIFASNPILPPPVPDSDVEEDEDEDFIGQVSIFQNGGLGVSETAEVGTQTDHAVDHAAVEALVHMGTQTEEVALASVSVKRQRTEELSPVDVISLPAGADFRAIVEEQRNRILEEQRSRILEELNRRPNRARMEAWTQRMSGVSVEDAMRIVENLNETHEGFTKNALIRHLVEKCRA